jgi:hypothetical protein
VAPGKRLLRRRHRHDPGLAVCLPLPRTLFALRGRFLAAVAGIAQVD